MLISFLTALCHYRRTPIRTFRFINFSHSFFSRMAKEKRERGKEKRRGYVRYFASIDARYISYDSLPSRSLRLPRASRFGLHVRHQRNAEHETFRCCSYYSRSF